MAGMNSSGTVGPPGSAGKILLSGDELEMVIVSALPENGPGVPSEFLNVVVKYPDGHERQHQTKDVQHLLTQITGQLKGRYNLKSFTFSHAPDGLAAGALIKTGDNEYDPQLRHD